MAYRNNLKSQNMVSGEAKSKATNKNPLRLVVGVWLTQRLSETVYAPILSCGHIDFDNATFFPESPRFWREGWKQTKFRCRTCGDIETANLFFGKCECEYRAMLIQETQFEENLGFAVQRAKDSGFTCGFNYFAEKAKQATV